MGARRPGIACGLLACAAFAAWPGEATAGTVSGSLRGSLVPARSRGAADVRAISLNTGIVARAARLPLSRHFTLKLPAGPYVLVTTVVDRKSGKVTSRVGPAVSVRTDGKRSVAVTASAEPRAGASYLQRSGRSTPAVRSLEVHDFSGASGKAAVANRGLSELLQTRLAAGGGGCSTALVADARDRAAVSSPRKRSGSFDGPGSVKRDLVATDISITGSLTSVRTTVDYAISANDARSGALVATVTGEIKLDDNFIAKVDKIGAELLRRICTPKAIALASPANGVAIGPSPADYVGVASTATGASSTVTIRIFEGPTATGLPLHTLTAARGAGGAFSVAGPALAPGSYTAYAEQVDAAGKTILSAANSFTVTGGDPAIIGAGDISGCGRSEGGKGTAALIAQDPTRALHARRHAYSSGQPDQFANCYGSTWGLFKARTHPVSGDHDSATVSGGPPPTRPSSTTSTISSPRYGPTALTA